MRYLSLHRFTGEERPGKDVIDEHIKWMAEQKRTGKMLDTDPLIVAGLREYKVYPWEVHHVDLESITTLVPAAHA